MKKTISQIVSDRILILDGAMGTMIQQYNLTEEDFRGKIFIVSIWKQVRILLKPIHSVRLRFLWQIITWKNMCVK